VAAIVVDCESGPVRLGLAVALARALGADCLDVAGLSAGGLADSVRAYREVA
jgi:magnesium chelatase subunit D